MGCLYGSSFRLCSLLPTIMMILASVNDVRCSCGMENPCPPAFPDFKAFFSQSTALIDELTIPSGHETNCVCVNLTDFNARIDSTNPVGTVCNPVIPLLSTVTPAPFATSLGSSVSTNVKNTTEGTTILTPIADHSTTESSNIPLIVGITVGVGGLLIISITAIVITVYCRHRGKLTSDRGKPILREVSTYSGITLINDDYNQPETPGTTTSLPDEGFPHTIFQEDSVRGKKCVDVRDSIIHESSTDGTFDRTKISDLSSYMNGFAVSQETLYPEETPSESGVDNKAFENDSEIEESSYSQENWENEWNNKFEEAMMDSSDSLVHRSDDVDNSGQKFKLSTEDQMTPSSSTVKPKVHFDLPSAEQPNVTQFDQLPSNTSFKPLSDLPKAAKSTQPSINPPSPTESKVRLAHTATIQHVSEPRSPSLNQTLDNPPAYSSAPRKPPRPDPSTETILGKHTFTTGAESPFDLSQPPSYSQAVASKTAVFQPKQGPVTPRKPSAKKLDFGENAEVQRKPTEWQKFAESPKQNHRNSANFQSIPSNYSNETIFRGGKGEESKGGNTAVVGPFAGALRSSNPGMSNKHSPTKAEIVQADVPNGETLSSDYGNENSVPSVRSLLNQFEAVQINDDSAENKQKTGVLSSHKRN